jgi:hypothetical protein
MIEKTPIGWRTLAESIPEAMPSSAPPAERSIDGMPHATSTLSMPRRTSPLLSSSVLPCSWVQIEQSSSKCASMRSRRAKRWRARACAVISRHAG